MIEGGGSGVVMEDQRVGGTGGARLRAQAAADGLNECRLPRAQLSRQPDYGRGAELSAEVLTEPAELARGEAHRQPSAPAADRGAPPPARNRAPRRRSAYVALACESTRRPPCC